MLVFDSILVLKFSELQKKKKKLESMVRFVAITYSFQNFIVFTSNEKI